MPAIPDVRVRIEMMYHLIHPFSEGLNSMHDHMFDLAGQDGAPAYVEEGAYAPQGDVTNVPPVPQLGEGQRGETGAVVVAIHGAYIERLVCLRPWCREYKAPPA